MRADLERNSDLLEAQLGVRPRVITWPFGRWNEVTVAAAREAGMPISLTLDPERADVRELDDRALLRRENPGLRFVSDALADPPTAQLLRGLCVHLDEMYAPSQEEQEARLGRILDRVLAFRPNMVLLAAASSAPGGGRVLPDRPAAGPGRSLQPCGLADSHADGTEIYAGYQPSRRAGCRRRYWRSTARWRGSVPFRGVSLGPISLAAELSPGAADRESAAGIPGRRGGCARRRIGRACPRGARFALRLLDAVARYQPASRCSMSLTSRELRRPTEMAADAVDYLAVRWDGGPEEAIRKLKDLGWLEGDHWGRLVYWSTRGVPAEWRRVQRAGILNSVYCPDRLLDRPGRAGRDEWGGRGRDVSRSGPERRMLEHAQTVVDALQRFEFVYPFVMAGVWVAGAVFFWWFEERGAAGSLDLSLPTPCPRAAVIVPCHNEAPQVRDTIRALTELRYPDYEIIAIDDGSTDGTGPILEALAADEPRLRVLRLPVNRGKAAALRAGIQLTDAEHVICIDGDALLDEDALAWMVRALSASDDIGGVTGNPRIRTRSTALGRLQIGEFSTLVGLIKRAQMVMGHSSPCQGWSAVFGGGRSPRWATGGPTCSPRTSTSPGGSSSPAGASCSSRVRSAGS